MRRTFEEHHQRPVVSLDGLWTLHPQDGTAKAYSAMVPGVWERIPALSRFRGVADYSRTVFLPCPGHYLLRLGAASHSAKVYWDETLVGQHYNAYTDFDILLTNATAGAHSLRVQVDNSFSDASTLHIPNDYFTYGGFTRSIELHRVSKVYIERMSFHSVKRGKGDYSAVVSVFLHALEATDDILLTVQTADGCADVKVDHLDADQRHTAEVTFPVHGVKEWDIFQPNLYDLTARLFLHGACVDDLVDHVGFRTVEIEGERICLNGRPVQIKGFNRHEDHGLFGCALPQEAMMDDLQRILDTGANSIRTCHYPNDPKFLDLCDELGLLVWEEHHARAIPMEIMRKPLFAQQASACNEEMITQHMNHPCIYIWGVLNECESETEEGRAIYAAQLAQLRQLDPTRPVSYASCRFFTDICMDLVDVVSWNIYPRWYHDESIRSYSDRLIAWMEAHGASGKPILITEVGAGGIAGYHDPFARAKWSEERQCDILEEQLTTLLTNPRLSGVYIWQFADVRVAEEWALNRPKAQNNKGVVDLFRQPKMSYLLVKRLYSATGQD